VLTGTVSEYNGLTELGTITACTTIATGKSYVINNVTTNDANTEPWEGCIVKVKNANCTGGTGGTFTVTDGSGVISIFKQLFQTLALTTGTNYDITGVMTYYKSGLIIRTVILAMRLTLLFLPICRFLFPKGRCVEFISLIGRNLTVSNVSIGTTVDIYSSIGSKVQSAQLQGGAVQLSNLAKGLYIVRVGNLSSKIML
jgi:hypothetical protein